MKSLLRMTALAVSLVAVVALAQTPPVKGTSSATSSPNLLDMVDKLDKLDKLDQQDFLGALDEADACTRGRRFSCSEAQIAKAVKLANGSKDQQKLAVVRQSLGAERRRVEDEIREAERVRVARAESARREYEAQARAEAAEEDRQQTAANISGLFSILGATASNYAAIRGQQQAAAKLGNSLLADSKRAADAARENNERLAREARSDTDRQRELERTRATRAEAERYARADAERLAARARTSETQAAVPKYQAPAGQGQSQVASNSNASSSSAKSTQAFLNERGNSVNIAKANPGIPSSAEGARNVECGAMGTACPVYGQNAAQVPKGYKDAFTENWERELARPKYVSSNGTPLSSEATESAARASALEIWEGTKKGIESDHMNHAQYGRILTVASPQCRPQRGGATKEQPEGQILNWLCGIAYTVERARQPATAGGTISK